MPGNLTSSIYVIIVIRRDETRTLTLEGWDRIPLEWINRRILSMPERLRRVAESERGELIGAGGGFSQERHLVASNHIFNGGGLPHWD